jgi:hypothetical protein
MVRSYTRYVPLLGIFLSYERSLLRSFGSPQLCFDLLTKCVKFLQGKRNHNFPGERFPGKLFSGERFPEECFPREAFPGKTLPGEIVKCAYQNLAQALELVVPVATQDLHKVRKRL